MKRIRTRPVPNGEKRRRIRKRVDYPRCARAAPARSERMFELMIYSLGDRHVRTRGDFYVADNAVVVGSVVLGHGASVWFNSVVRGDNDVISIGDGTNIQDAAVLHVDEGIPLTLGANVSVGHHAMLHGCTVEDGALVGINAVVLNHAVIGRGSLVGAGALVPEGKVIPERSLALGTPARVVRTLTDEDVTGIRQIALHYMEKARRYHTELRVQEEGAR